MDHQKWDTLKYSDENRRENLDLKIRTLPKAKSPPQTFVLRAHQDSYSSFVVHPPVLACTLIMPLSRAPPQCTSFDFVCQIHPPCQPKSDSRPPACSSRQI